VPMKSTSKRLAAAALSMLLLSLLIWMRIRGLGDVWFHGLTLTGVVLGFAYARHGLLPDWVVRMGDGTITPDDDESNVSPRIYLPIIGAAIVLAAASLFLVIYLG